MNWYFLQGIEDPRLLAGSPRTIRSDEWMVQQSWVVSQFMQGFPVMNKSFPGGMDMTVFNDLPVWEWSSFFRPHTWGYLFFGLDVGIAWYWWLPSIAMCIGVYLFVITISPQRIMAGIFISIATFFTPFIQWWYQPTTIWAVAWTLISLTALLWVLRSSSKNIRWIWAGIFAYVSVLFAIEIYLPFIIPAVVIFIFVGSGLVLNERNPDQSLKANLSALARSLMPIIAASLTAFIFIAIWALTRKNTINAILNTVYPGARNISSGSALDSPNANMWSLLGSTWSSILKETDYPTILGINPSEASSSLPIVFILIPSIIVLSIWIWKKYKTIEFPLFGATTVTFLFLGNMYIQNIDLFTQIFFLNIVPENRLKIGFVILFPILVTLLIKVMDKYEIKISNFLLMTTLGVGFVLLFPVLIKIRMDTSAWPLADKTWMIIFPLIIAGAAFLFLKKLITSATLIIAIAAILTSWGINPLYKGLYPLNTTLTGKAVSEIDSIESGNWIGVGGFATRSILTQTGVSAFSGVQNYPIEELWSTLDPKNVYEEKWNRLAHIHWTLTNNNFKISTPQSDVISVEIDPCNPLFDDKKIFLLSDLKLDNKCLSLMKQTKEKNSEFWIYKIEKN
jgi:hypothetical protein